MKFHGSVSFALFTLCVPALGQDGPVPRLLSTPEQLAPEPQSVPRQLPPPPGIPGGNASSLESEVEALRSDLQTFHTLSEDLARSARELEAKSDRASTQQRQEMMDLLTKIATQGIARKPARDPDLPAAKPPEIATRDTGSSLAVTDATVDSFALGKVLFRSGDFVKAEQAFRRVTPTDDNRAMLKYLIATCQYRRMRIQEAVEGYREVAASDDDPVVRDFAKSQLDSIRWRQEFDKQLDQLRKQRDKQSGGPAPRFDDKGHK